MKFEKVWILPTDRFLKVSFFKLALKIRFSYCNCTFFENGNRLHVAIQFKYACT
eukprot:UN23951